MRHLNDIRKDINSVDKKIRELFIERIHLAEQVAEYKLETDDKVLKPDREAELISVMSSDVDESIRQKYISMLKTSMRVSRMHQYEYMLQKKPSRLDISYNSTGEKPKSVVYQGIPASYQSQAVKSMFGDVDNVSHVEKFEDVFKAVSNGDAEIGVVPIENSSIGTINEVCDLLVKYNLYIYLSHIDNINHCLAGCKGATIYSIKKVYSITPALDQCKKFLSENKFELCEASNTAVAAQQVFEWNDKTKAAVCSEQAANLYGLSIISSCINDNKQNQTRFVAISKKLCASLEDDRVSVSFTLPHTEGTLASALSMFSDRNINLTEIHSRPIAETPWNYRFYVDFVGGLEDKNTKTLIYQLSEELPSFRLLGSYKTTQNI